jgi:hypothetical protein
MKPIVAAASAILLAGSLPTLAHAQRGGPPPHAGQPGPPPHAGQPGPPPHAQGRQAPLWHPGYRLPREYRDWTDYRAIPERYRTRVPTGYRYIYRDDRVYVVDPRTRVVRSIIDLLM